jgi:tRNA dimethylallyltransferase
MYLQRIKNPLVVIVGPTAVGKTEFSIQIAKALSAEIISADSRYFYREMNIGTAKPLPEELQGVPHHLIDVARPDESWNLALFQQQATKIITDIHQKKKLPIIVGGTGQYIQAVLGAWSMPSQAADNKLREILEKMVIKDRGEELYAFLKKVDPAAANLIDWRNVRRTIRAVEVILKTGVRFSEQRTISTSPYSRKMIGLYRDRTELYRRIDLRIEQMLSRGLVEEVQHLLASGYTADLPALSAIGYREICSYLQGRISLEEAIVLMKRQTRTFVRRQANWFKLNDPNIRWYPADQLDLKDIIDYIKSEQDWIPPDI